MIDLREEVARWLLVLEDSDWEWDKESDAVRNMCLLNADALLALLKEQGVVQLDKNQNFSPFAGIPVGFQRVHPLVEK